MPQISLYIDQQTLQKVEQSAKQQNISISKWVAEQIKANLDVVYPNSFANLFGSINDPTFQKPLELEQKLDTKRLSF